MMYVDFPRTEGPNFSPRRRARAFVVESGHLRCSRQRRDADCIAAGRKHARGIGNTLRCCRIPPTSTPQDPDFVLRRVSSGCDGRNKGMQSRGKEDDHGRVGNAQYPSVLCMCVQFSRLQRCRRPCAETCFCFRTTNRCAASKVSRVQAGGEIEGDGDDRGDGDEDSPYSLSLDNSQAQDLALQRCYLNKRRQRRSNNLPGSEPHLQC
ncbi:hypothetical protein ARMSODRAFT_62991 [Armillaria solidipes]|uniref:Uncharacterized protein n=1 Tax=Armillaria solidipes TaxID=1076256 RepID=A0A2H3BJR5_9AGAR|nr:hypothetical protein ARMSODRAFT_62991 [Armillaria solidipes]